MSSPLQLSQLTQLTPYDNSVSFLYKQAVKLDVPVRFVIIRPKLDVNARQLQTFNLEEHKDSDFITIFEYIRQLIKEDPTITLIDIWNNLKQMRGDLFNPLDLVFIWLHALPEYRQVISGPAGQIIFDQILSFLNSLGEPENYTNIGDVMQEYETIWLPSYQAEFQKDIEILQKYVRSQTELLSIEPVAHSDLTVDSLTLAYEYPTEPGINPLPDIFNSAITSYIVPFIQYNILPMKGQSENIKRYYKIYKGRSVDSQPNYGNVTLSSAQTSRGNTIYVNMWAENTGSEDARFGKKESFEIMTITYIESANVLRVVVSIPHLNEISEDLVIDRLHEHLPGLPRPQQTQTTLVPIRLSGSFMLYGVDLVELVLFQLIMNDPLFDSYLYLEEGTRSFAEKTRISIHYRGASAENTGAKVTKSAASATLSEQTILAGTPYILQNGEQHTEPRNIQAVLVKITRAPSKEVAEKFMDIVARLFRKYSLRGREIITEYLTFVPEYRSVLLARKAVESTPTVVTTVGPIIDPTLTRIKQLQKYAPDVFVKRYARRCQKPFQPLPISPDEVKTWVNKTITVFNRQEERQVMLFPRNDPKYIFVCPTDKYPYPTLVENTLSNRDIYPFLPCCANRNKLTNQNSLIRHYYFDAPRRKVRTASRTGHLMTTGKIMTPGRHAYISPAIASFLSAYDDESGEIYRYGVPRSINSFIHCVALARGDPGYKNASDKEEYVSELRRKLFQLGILPEVLRQELYDMTNEDIAKLVTENREFFDPLMFYRAMETLFKCNIYIFMYRPQEKNKAKIKASSLQLPRHKYFHVSPPNPGPVVLILRNLGSESNALEYPQCELIVDQRADGLALSFDENMNNLVYPALSFVARTLSWQIYESQGPQLICRMNLYSTFNFKSIFGEIPIIGQIIDSSGKARMFALAPEWANTQHTEFTQLRIFVNVPPTAPLNIPEFQPKDATNKLPPYGKLIELFGIPVSATSSVDKRYLTGLWFPLSDIQFGFYCPCQDTDWTIFIQQYPDINQNSELAALTIHIPRTCSTSLSPSLVSLSCDQTKSSIQRIKQLSRVAKFIDQILKYLYTIAGRPSDVAAFLRTIALKLSSDNKPDSITIYDSSKFTRILPTGTVEEILSTLSQQIPYIFPTGKLLVYDDKMYQGILYQLKRFIKQTEGLGLTPADLRELTGFYINKEDFNFDPKTEFILGSIREFNAWVAIYVPSSSLQQRVIQNLKDTIQIRLNPNAFSYQEPYIYQNSGNAALSTSYDPTADNFYLIQNVAGGNIKRAMQVAYNWFMEKRNTGFATEEYQVTSELLPAHMIYKIGPGGGIIVEQNNTDGPRYLEILHYGNNMHAAMLPLL